MKRISFLCAAGLALIGANPLANATSFTYKGSLQTFTVTTTGVYLLSAAGAQGGPKPGSPPPPGEVIDAEYVDVDESKKPN